MFVNPSNLCLELNLQPAQNRQVSRGDYPKSDPNDASFFRAHYPGPIARRKIVKLSSPLDSNCNRIASVIIA